MKQLDPRLRGDDEKITSETFYERIKKSNPKKPPVPRFLLRFAGAAGARGNSPACGG